MYMYVTPETKAVQQSPGRFGPDVAGMCADVTQANSIGNTMFFSGLQQPQYRKQCEEKSDTAVPCPRCV